MPAKKAPKEPKLVVGILPGSAIMGTKTHERWKAEREAKPFTSSVVEPHATGSQAGGCSRKIAFSAFGISRSEPENEWNIVTFKIGQRLHDFIQETLRDEFNAQLEVRVDMRPQAYVTGFADGLIPMHPQTFEAGNTVIEIKSMAQYAFDLATGTKGTSPGPKAEHITQGAMYGTKLGAKWLWIIYYGKDRAKTAEWVLGMDEPLAHLNGVTPRQLAEQEIERMAEILETGNGGELPGRFVPGYGLINDPTIDDPDDPDYCWHCAYCNWRTTCSMLPADRAALEPLLMAPVEERPAVLPGDLPHVKEPLADANVINAVRDRREKLGPQLKLAVDAWARQSAEAGKPLGLKKNPYVRTVAIANAIMACAEATDADESVVRAVLAVVLGYEPQPGVTTGAVFGSLTADEADRCQRFAAALGDDASGVVLTFADNGTPVVLGNVA